MRDIIIEGRLQSGRRFYTSVQTYWFVRGSFLVKKVINHLGKDYPWMYMRITDGAKSYMRYNGSQVVSKRIEDEINLSLETRS